MATVLPRGQRLGGQLGIFELVFDLDGAFQRRFQRSHDVHIQLIGQRDDQTVPAVFDIGNDFLDAGGCLAVIFVLVIRVNGALGPAPLLDIQPETTVLFVLTAGPAEIHAPQFGGIAVLQLGKKLAADEQARGAKQWPAIALGEAHAGLDLVSEAEAFLLITIDALAPPGDDILLAEHI